MKRRSRMAMTLCLALALAVTACGGGTGSGGPSGSGNRPRGEKIVIYAGGSSEFSWIEGSEEAAVIEHIEQRYYDETGNSLDFEISYLGENMKTKLASEIAGGSQVDIAISHTRGGDGIDDYVSTGKNVDFYDLADLLYDAPNLTAHIDAYSYDNIESTPLDTLTNYNDQVVGIPSVVNPYKFGILVRKDLMEQAGYTDDPAKAQTAFDDSRNYILVDNLEDFAEMCKAMNTLTGGTYAISGAPWDLEKVITLGAFGNSGYFTNTLYNNKIVPGSVTGYYKEVLKLEYEWARPYDMTGGIRRSIISPEASAIKLDRAENAFVAGNTGVFVQDPTIQHLIKVARMTKANVPTAEFTVLGPMRAYRDVNACPQDADGNPLKGFMRNPEATFAAVILSTSRNARKIIEFLDWVYSDEDIYNLCRYGIEGEHWINNGDGTYSYPAGKEEYLTRAPYSGILTLVENQHISNLTYAGYTEEELGWIALAADESNYIVNNVADYMFPATGSQAVPFSNARNNMADNLVYNAWAGILDPVTGTDDKGVTNVAYTFDVMAAAVWEEGEGYINTLTNYYQIMKNDRDAKFAEAKG